MRKLLTILLLTAAVVGITYWVKPKQAVAPPDQNLPITDQTAVIADDYVQYRGIEGRTAFELLRDITDVGYKQYDFGVFIESINGVKPDAQHFWKLYVNGTESQVGADSMQTRNGDVIEWKLEEIK